MTTVNPLTRTVRAASDVGGVELASPPSSIHRPSSRAPAADPAKKKAAVAAIRSLLEAQDKAAEASEMLRAQQATLEREDASEQDVQDACTGGAAMVDTMQTASSPDVLDSLEEAGATLPHRAAKVRRALRYGVWWDTLLELLNEIGDVLFLIFKLPAHPVLFWWSFVALCGALLMRLAIALSFWPRVDKASKKGRYAAGVLVSLLEPMTGSRMVKRALRRHDEVAGETTWDYGKGMYVTAERQRDQRAVRAENDLLAATNEIRFVVVLVLVEDLQELAIQIIFLAWTEELDFGKLINDPLLLLTTFGTLAHMVRQLAEAHALLRELPALRLAADLFHDKTFGPDATDADVAAFARKAGAAARCVNLRGCEGVGDAGAKALAEHCPHLVTVNFGGCSELTDAAVTALATHCAQLTSVAFGGCDNLTDAGRKKIQDQWN